MYFLIITAITVSLDSFACGICLTKENDQPVFIVAVITLTVFLMCLFASLFARAAATLLTEKSAALGGILLIAIGFADIFKRKQNAPEQITVPSRNKYFGVGFAVGLDGALANLSLSLMGFDSLFAPLIISLMHGVAVSFGILIGKIIKKNKSFNFDLLSSFALIVMGTLKLFELFK